jgi:hypothetical protein
MKVLAILFALLALAAVALAQNSSTVASSKVRLTTNPGAGSIDIANIAAAKTFRITFDYIREITPAGAELPTYNSFNNAQFTTSSSESDSVGGANAKRASLNGGQLQVTTGVNTTLTANMNVDVYAITADNTTSANIAGSTYEVADGSAVITINLSGWPVASEANRLVIAGSIRTPSKSGASSSGVLSLYDGATLRAAEATGQKATLSISGQKATFVYTITNSTANPTINFLFKTTGQADPSSASRIASLFSLLF